MCLSAAPWVAALVLGEVVRWRRWSATIVGFIGVVVVMRPGAGEFSPAYLVAVAGAATGAAITLTTRALARREAPVQIMAYIATGEWQGKAGGYAIQGSAAAHIRFLSGSHSSVVGLPLFETAQLLRGLGYNLP